MGMAYGECIFLTMTHYKIAVSNNNCYDEADSYTFMQQLMKADPACMHPPSK